MVERADTPRETNASFLPKDSVLQIALIVFLLPSTNYRVVSWDRRGEKHPLCQLRPGATYTALKVLLSRIPFRPYRRGVWPE
jgi:hypothetical protein